MVRRGDVSLFNDVHRWMAMEVDEIETLRARHQRLNSRRKETLTLAASQLRKDTDERKKQVNEFSLELEQYTLRKFDLLKDDVVAAHIQKSHTENGGGDSDDHARKQRQLHTLCKDLDVMHTSLLHVSKDMVNLFETCCGPAEGEIPHHTEDVLDTSRHAPLALAAKAASTVAAAAASQARESIVPVLPSPL